MTANTVPETLKYTKTHEWVRQENDGTCVVGITDYAQSKLGDLVYIELPEVNSEFKAGEECCTFESVKAASEIFAPISGTIIAVNQEVESKPALVNQDPYGQGWILRIKPSYPEELDDLLDAEAYTEIQASVSHTY